MQAIEEPLRALRDVQGVHGSFVITMSGALVARDLPTAFDNELFSEVGPRIARLHDTFRSGGEEIDACVLRYQEHKLYLRKMTAGLIGVLSGVGVNMPALRMVSNLLIRRIDPIVVELTKPGATPPLPPPSPLEVVVARPPPAIPAATATAASAPTAPTTPVANGRSAAAATTASAAPLPTAFSSDPWVLDSQPTNGNGARTATIIVPQDGRDPSPPQAERHVRMYRGRRVED